MAKSQAKQLVVCVNNEGYPASLERRKIYVAFRDADSEKHGLIRIVDEFGDDYLYPKALFQCRAARGASEAVLAAAWRPQPRDHAGRGAPSMTSISIVG